MPEVHRVRHRTLKTQHALKVLMRASTRIRDRLIQEVLAGTRTTWAEVLRPAAASPPRFR